MSERALESDVAVREADLRGVLTFYLIRHGALLGARDDEHMTAIYGEARNSAEREILWRFAQAGGGAPSLTLKG